MVLRSGIIIPFQYREAKKLLMIGGPEENRNLNIFDLKNVVRAAFGIYNFEFRNQKIGFNIPDELLLLYLAQRQDLTNFVIEVGQANENSDVVAAASSTKDLLCFEPSSSTPQKRSKTSVAPQVVPESNESSDDDQSSNQERPQPPCQMRISQVFPALPTSETFSQSADDSMDMIVPKIEIRDAFGEHNLEYQYTSEFMNSTTVAQQSQECMPSTNKREPEPLWHSLESAIQAMQQQSQESMTTMPFSNKSRPSWHSLESTIQAMQAIRADSVALEQELQRLLEEKHKIIIENFKAHQKLTNNERVKISKTIVQYLLTDPNRTLSSTDLQNISELICKIFVGELPTTYYVKSSHGRVASGKMNDAYRNYRSSLAASGLITRRQRILKTEVQTNPPLEIEQTRRTEEQIAHEEAALQLLKIKEENFEESIELWKKTFFYRQEELVKTQMPAAEYIKKYTILEKPHGFKLYIADVERKFKTKVALNMRADFWQNMLERTKLVRSDCLSRIVELIQAEPREDNKHVIALMILPFLFPVSLKRGNQGITKPTKEESAQTFICHFPDMKTAESGIQKHIAKTTIDSDRLIQPVIVFVGHPVIVDSFVIVGDVRYEFKDIKDSITCATAAFLALNLKYPKCSEKVWFFVQRYICNISTPFDTCLENKVKTLAKDLNFIWK